MSETGWGIVFVLGLAAAGTVVVTVLIWQAFRTVRLRLTSGGVASRAAVDRRRVEDATAAPRGMAEGEREIAPAPAASDATEGAS